MRTLIVEVTRLFNNAGYYVDKLAIVEKKPQPEATFTVKLGHIVYRFVVTVDNIS